MVKETGQVINEKMNLKVMAKGIMVSYIITIPVFIIFAFILTYTSFPQKMISPMVVVTTILSILAAGLMITKNLKNKGWLNGGVAGVVYMGVLYVVSSIVLNDFSIDRYVITMMIIGLFTGCIGGIIGINTSKSSRSKYKSLKR